jgi:outer membrane protein TolC
MFTKHQSRRYFMNRLTTIVIMLLLVFSGVIAQNTPMTLEDCIQIALKGNSTIIINKNLNESADEDVDGSYAGILPTANLNAQTYRVEAGASDTDRDVPVGFEVNADGDTLAVYERRTITQPGYTTNRNTFGISVNQNLFDGGEWWNAINYAQSQKDVSDKTLLSTINNTILDVEQKFYDLLKAEKLLEVNQLAVQRSEDQLNKTQKMFELGAVAKVDVYRSRVNLGNDKINMLLQKNAMVRAKHNLNLAMGRDANTELEIATTGLEIRGVYQGPDDLINQGMANNPDIQKNEAEVNTSSIQVSRSYAYLWPSIGLAFGYDRANEGFERVYSGWDKNWSIYYGIGLQLNLFNGLRDKVRIQKAKLAERNAMESFEEAKRNLQATIFQYIEDFNSYLEIIEINEENLEAAKEEYRLAEERYRIGSGTQLEVREAQVNLTQAEETLVRAKYSALVTQAQMQNAIGTISTKYMETSE